MQSVCCRDWVSLIWNHDMMYIYHSLAQANLLIFCFPLLARATIFYGSCGQLRSILAGLHWSRVFLTLAMQAVREQVTTALPCKFSSRHVSADSSLMSTPSQPNPRHKGKEDSSLNVQTKSCYFAISTAPHPRPFQTPSPEL